MMVMKGWRDVLLEVRKAGRPRRSGIGLRTDFDAQTVRSTTPSTMPSAFSAARQNGFYVLDHALTPLAIPSTLQDSLMARLDRLAPVKEIAQIGAAIGREFSYQ